jgi:hypothetical protein
MVGLMSNNKDVTRRTVLGGAAAIAGVASLQIFADGASAANGNGQVAPSQLTAVPGSSGTVLLERNTAVAWLAMVAACKKATGVTMVVTSPDGGYRDLAMQKYLYDHPQGPVPIAAPGSSTHGWGTAIDIWNRQYSWLTANAAVFGFRQTFASEPWHWQYNGSPQPTPIASNPTAEENMSFSLVKDAQSPTIFACSTVTGKRVGIASPYHLSLLQRYKVNNTGDPMLVAELDIVASYLRQIAP